VRKRGEQLTPNHTFLKDEPDIKAVYYSRIFTRETNVGENTYRFALHFDEPIA